MVRGVVSPEERFREDPLRLLRAVRIAAELGFRIEEKTLKAISSMAEAIMNAAPERIRDELVKILLCGKPSQGLHLLRKTGLLGWILPELVAGGRVRGTIVDQVAPDPVLRLSALFCAIAQSSSPDHGTKSEKAAKSIMLRLCFSKSTIRRVVQLIKEQEALSGYHSSWSDGDLRRIVRRAGAEHMEALIALRRAGLLAWGRRSHQPLHLLDEIQERIRGVMKTPVVRGPQDLAIDGSKIMKVTGLSPGPEVGRTCKAPL